ncbi:hypothetical protein HYW46_00880 [Candidatus Daviesbacteria bacterium]|nr:hypothetical protein [Candidatus Daviesbacteria bacterium]
MIQTVLALSQFFINNFPPPAGGWWYPYWYLGNPYHYLIGPVVPIILAIINFKFQISNFGFPIYLGLLGVSWVVGGVGVYQLVEKLSQTSNRKSQILYALLFMFLPFSLFLLAYSNGLYHFAWGFLPWVFVVFLRFLVGSPMSLRDHKVAKQSNLIKIAALPSVARNDEEKKGIKIALLLSILVSFVLLVDVSILLPMLVGFVCLGVVIKDIKGVKGINGGGEYQVFKTFFVLLFALSLATIWYTPGFWLTLLQNPSFGGMPLVNLGKFLFQLLLNLVPILAAVWVVKLRMKNLSRTAYFGLLFLSSFLFLTIIRYLSDPDFVQDWIGFFIEIQFGLAILLGSFLSSSRMRGSFRRLIPAFAGMTVLLVFIVKGWMGGENVKYQSKIVSMLKNVPKDERVFLSGTSVFWANQYLDIIQVRGGVDQASIHPYWADGAYQIREGENSELSLNWLRALGVSWILVHSGGSDEPYRDFKRPEKFTQICHPRLDRGSILEKDPRIREDDTICKIVKGIKGDTLYKVGGASIARVADKSILEVKKPKNGADAQTLAKYVNTFKIHPGGSPPGWENRPGFTNVIEVDADLGKDEVISLAIAYDRGWQVQQFHPGGGTGGVRLVKDNLGNIVLIPGAVGRISLSLVYQTPVWERAAPVLISLVLLFILVNYDKSYPGMSRILAKVGHGLGEEE